MASHVSLLGSGDWKRAAYSVLGVGYLLPWEGEMHVKMLKLGTSNREA